MKPAPAPYPKLHRYDFRTLKRATILFTEPGRGQHIEQEHVGCESVALRKAITAARKTFDRVLAIESKRKSAQSPPTQTDGPAAHAGGNQKEPAEERKR